MAILHERWSSRNPEQASLKWPESCPTVSPALLYMPCAGWSGMSEVQVFLTPMHLAIAMEYAKGGNLFHYLLQHGPHCRLTEAKAQWIFQQLIIGLDYCHRRVSAC